MTSRTSPTPEVTALSLTKAEAVVLAMMEARVVLPTPGGPKKMLEVRRSASMARRKRVPLPTICFCPMNSSRFLGRIRSASGRIFSSFPANRSMFISLAS